MFVCLFATAVAFSLMCQLPRQTWDCWSYKSDFDCDSILICLAWKKSGDHRDTCFYNVVAAPHSSGALGCACQ